MSVARKIYFVLIVALLLVPLSGCSPEVGSPEWCIDMKEKPKGNWTTNEAGDFAKHCLFTG